MLQMRKKYLSRLYGRLSAILAYFTAYDNLMKLTNREMSDIGITRDQVCYYANRAAWMR